MDGRRCSNLCWFRLVHYGNGEYFPWQTFMYKSEYKTLSPYEKPKFYASWKWRILFLTMHLNFMRLLTASVKFRRLQSILKISRTPRLLFIHYSNNKSMHYYLKNAYTQTVKGFVSSNMNQFDHLSSNHSKVWSILIQQDFLSTFSIARRTKFNVNLINLDFRITTNLST